MTLHTIYDILEVDSLVDFIEIKGDDKEGFYYDFRVNQKISEEDLKNIESKMKEIAKTGSVAHIAGVPEDAKKILEKVDVEDDDANKGAE